MPISQERVLLALDTIMLASDFSPSSERAAAFAKALARRFGSTIEIAHVLDPSSVDSYEEAIMPEMLDERRQFDAERLERMKESFVAGSFSTRTVLLESHQVVAALLKAAKRDNVDLIVAGTDSKTGMKRMLLGSTAEAILRHAECPVLTVGPNAELPLDGPLSFKKVLFATDFSEAASRAAMFALAFAEEGGARLCFCHVLGAYPGSQREAPIIDEMFKTALASMIPENSYEWCSPDCTLEHGQAVQGILSAARRLGADLIVLGPRKGSFVVGHLDHGLTPDLLAAATCPVLTVC